MTAREVFEYFCGKYRIKPFIRKAYFEMKPIDWSVYMSGPRFFNGNYSYASDINNWLPFSKHFTNIFTAHGFNDMLYQVTSTAYYAYTRRYKKFSYAAKKWKYFSRHNIVVKESSLKIGDEVAMSRTWLNGNGSLKNITVKITSIDAETCSAIGTITDGSNKPYRIFFTRPIVVNGENREIEYAIKERGKIVKE